MSSFLIAVMVKSRIINAVFIRAIQSQHGKTKLGYLMVLLRPIAQIIMLSTIFSILNRAVIGESFALFIATGLIPYNLCMGLANKMMQINNTNRTILTTTHITPFDISIAYLLMESIILLIVSTIIFLGIGNLGYWDYTMDSVLGISLTTLSAIALGYGVGVFNFSIATIFPAYENVWKILSMPLFFMSGVFYIADQRFPEEVLSILYFNPLIHISELMRDNFYRSWDSSFADTSYLIWFITTALFVGLLMQKLTQKRSRK